MSLEDLGVGGFRFWGKAFLLVPLNGPLEDSIKKLLEGFRVYRGLSDLNRVLEALCYNYRIMDPQTLC